MTLSLFAELLEHYHVAVRADGTLWAWGGNRYGELGNGTFNTNSPSYGNPTPQQIGTRTNWQAVAVGVQHTVALRSDGTLWGWGANQYGQLGIGRFNTNNPNYAENTPQQVGSDTNWQAIAAGWSHTLALRADGTLWAWGDNTYGQLGNGTFSTNALPVINTPQKIGTNTDWQAVAARYNSTVALRTDGTLWAWGYNVNGQLGIGTFNTNFPYSISTPQRVGSDMNWQAVAPGGLHTVALRTDGTLWAWGNNGAGGLGNGTYTSTNTPQRVGTNADWQAVAAGTHTVALRADGTLWAWGLNDFGQLGIGTFATNSPYATNTPQQVGTNENWRAIAAGRHTVALRADGTLWTWGLNINGQLGIGMLSTNAPDSPRSGFGIATPQQVGTNTNWGPPP